MCVNVSSSLLMVDTTGRLSIKTAAASSSAGSWRVEFAARKQLGEFLQYVSEAAFQCRTHLDQVEIAEHVLHRSRDFNPIDDASVRKLASLTRHGLEAYYAGTGQHDSIAVELPVRSYIPKSTRSGEAARRSRTHGS